MVRFIITGDLWLAVSRMVVVAVQQVPCFSCVVVLTMLARSFSSGVSCVSARFLVSKDSWWWGLFSCAVFGGSALRHAVSVFGILVLFTFWARVVALSGCVWCNNSVGCLLLYSVS